MLLIKRIFSLPALTLVVALSLSVIAAWYSILGLTAIFAAAVIPIIIMGGALEFAKVVTTVWLHRYWNRAGWQLKLYLVPAVLALALLTSMGIFGFLSKAHIDQGIPTGDTAAQVALIDEKIANERQNIEAARSLLKQLDDAVIGITASKDREIKQRDGSVFSQSGAERAVQIRRAQAKDRADITRQIEEAQARIVKLQEEKAPIASELRKIEAEVGPIKYVAAMIYGDNPDANLLERAVRWMMILIVAVFDPLALMLVIAAQKSFKWMKEDEEKKNDEVIPLPIVTTEPIKEPEVAEPLEVKETPNPTPTKFDDPGEHPLDRVESVETTTERVEYEGNSQSNDIELHVLVGKDVQQAPVATTDAIDTKLEPVQNAPVESTEPKSEVKAKEINIKTEGVTLNETDGGYIQYDGKSVQKDALKEMHPELFMLTADSTAQVDTNFGTHFPRIARKGDVFVRVDMLPNRVFKFDGYKWIEINKSQTDSYLYDEAYIRYLVDKLDKGEYDIELLSDNERQQIEEYLQK